MSLVKLLRKTNRKFLFTTPSHNQKYFIFNKFRQFYKYDISETEFHNPQSALSEAQERAKNIYKSDFTYFLTNGSTSGIIASVLTSVKKGEQVLLWDNAHPSHLNAVRLAGANPVFYQLPIIEEWGISDKVTIEVLEPLIKNVKAVIITSPSYEGVISDIVEVKKLCEKYQVTLIVDEAHGALYPFSDKLPKTAIGIADFTIQSLHKTAGGLNPTALLHSKYNCENALKMINTSSPSYPLLASIEANINFLNSKKGREKIDKLIENIENLHKECPDCKFYGKDITKIVVKCPDLSGEKLSQILYEKFNIEDEKTNAKSTMLLCGIGTDKKKLERLEHALKNVTNC